MRIMAAAKIVVISLARSLSDIVDGKASSMGFMGAICCECSISTVEMVVSETKFVHQGVANTRGAVRAIAKSPN